MALAKEKDDRLKINKTALKEFERSALDSAKRSTDCCTCMFDLGRMAAYSHLLEAAYPGRKKDRLKARKKILQQEQFSEYASKIIDKIRRKYENEPRTPVKETS